MRTGAIVCIVLAVISTFVAIKNVSGASGNMADDPGFAGYVVGSFLVPMALAIVGLKLWGKTKQS